MFSSSAAAARRAASSSLALSSSSLSTTSLVAPWSRWLASALVSAPSGVYNTSIASFSSSEAAGKAHQLRFVDFYEDESVQRPDYPIRLMFLGAPGAGKGTFATRVAPALGIPTISTGNIIRAEIQSGSTLGKELQEMNNAGKLVPDEVVTEMAHKRLSQDDTKKGFILDGFPRTPTQAQTLDEWFKLDAVINVFFPENLLVEKTVSRRVCRGCGRNYNIAAIKEGKIDLPPLLPQTEGVCDQCGGELFQRSDDTEDIVRTRLRAYDKQTRPLIEHYEGKGIVLQFDVRTGIEDTPALLRKIAQFVASQRAKA